MSNIPYCFEKYKNVRIVLDCTEITVQKPKCLSCRIKLYSTYKSNFTIKYLIGKSSAGLITFVIKPYVYMVDELRIMSFLNRVI